MRHITLIIAVLALAIAAPAIAGKGGVHGGGSGGGGGNDPAPATGSCTVSGNVVTGTGLPAGQVLNFMVTDNGGTWGWVLGYTDTGTWAVTVPAQNGPTTYEFASKTWGPNGSKYDVYANCSA
jgi:hypothetical protein